MTTTIKCPFKDGVCLESECMAWNPLPDDVYCLICTNHHKNKSDVYAKILPCVATDGKTCPFRGCSALREVTPMNMDWVRRAYVHKQKNLTNNQVIVLTQ